MQLPIIQDTVATIQANVPATEAAAAVISTTKLAKSELFSEEKGTILIDDCINKVKIYYINETNDTQKIALALSLLRGKTEEYCREYSRKVANSDPTIGTFEQFCDYMRNNYGMRDLTKVRLREYEKLFENPITWSKVVQEQYLSFGEKVRTLAKASQIDGAVVKDHIIRKILPHLERVSDMMEAQDLISPGNNIFDPMDCTWRVIE